MLKAIPKKLLIHDVILKTFIEDNVTNQEKFKEPVEIKQVRIQKDYRYNYSHEIGEFVSSNLLFIDYKNSIYTSFSDFTPKSIIKYNNNEYIIKEVEEVEGFASHHLEVILE